MLRERETFLSIRALALSPPLLSVPRLNAVLQVDHARAALS